ncbi:MAG: hypothetical protein ACREEK_15405 [Bradyrhizobium sp.]
MRPDHNRVACLALALSIIVGGYNAAAAAELAIPPRSPAKIPRDFSIQSGPPNCSRWTDDCVNCSRGVKDEPAVCSNIGFACQPKAIRCLSAQ